MKICFTSDLHGKEGLYDQLRGLVAVERPELLILGGDLNAEGDIDDPVGTQVAFVHHELVPRIDRLRARLPGLSVAVILGNHDWSCTLSALRHYHAERRLILLDHLQPVVMGGVSFLGYSNTPPTPFWVKDFERLDEPEDDLPETGGVFWDVQLARVVQRGPREHFGALPSIREDLARTPIVEGPWILVAHAPPHETPLDRLPHIEHPLGSRAIRAFIESRRPIVSLHGHFHESPQVTGEFHHKLRTTLAVNPGQSTHDLHAVLFESADPEKTLRHTVFG